jgi:rubredoxin-NAD+ reductase
LIAGAGLVGSELANDLALAGHHITLLDTNPRPLANLLSEEASSELLAAWQHLPLTFIGVVSIDQVCAKGRARQVRTKDGQLFEADHVLAATGLQTPSRLAQSAGLAWHDGIAVDGANLRTNVSNIHALGDCISIEGKAHRYIEPIARQARVIAAHLTGDTPAPYVSSRPVVRIKTGSRGFTV